MTDSKQIVFIAPRLPPIPCGVGDTVAKLARFLLASDSNIKVKALIPVDAPDTEEPYPVYRFQKNAESLAKALTDQVSENSLVILSYSGYGFHPLGMPRWLIQGIKQSRSESHFHFVTHFHELAVRAFSKPPKTILLKLLQTHVVWQLGRLSDFIVTSGDEQKRTLKFLFPGREIALIGSPSTIGEANIDEINRERDNCIVVFGLPDSRNRLYSLFGREFSRFCSVNNVQRIIEIGPEGNSHFDFPVERIAMGVQEFSKIKEIILKARFGALAYDALRLRTSSVFAAYCSCATLPVVFSTRGDLKSMDFDFIIDGVKSKEAVTDEKQQRQKAYDYYMGNQSVAQMGDYFLSLLMDK